MPEGILGRAATTFATALVKKSGKRLGSGAAKKLEPGVERYFAGGAVDANGDDDAEDYEDDDDDEDENK